MPMPARWNLQSCTIHKVNAHECPSWEAVNSKAKHYWKWKKQWSSLSFHILLNPSIPFHVSRPSLYQLLALSTSHTSPCLSPSLPVSHRMPNMFLSIRPFLPLSVYVCLFTLVLVPHASPVLRSYSFLLLVLIRTSEPLCISLTLPVFSDIRLCHDFCLLHTPPPPCPSLPLYTSLCPQSTLTSQLLIMDLIF